MQPKFIKVETVTAELIRREETILFEVQKREVTDADLARVTELVNALNECGKRGRGKIGLSFAYDDDPRELCEIPEVVTYVKRLFALCPHLVYFLLPDVNAVRAFLFCLSDAKVGSHSRGMAQMDVDEAVFIHCANQLAENVRDYGKRISDSAGAAALLNKLGF